MRTLITCIFCLTLIFFYACQHEENLLNDKSHIVHSNSSMVLIKAAIKIAIGGTVYENLDGHVRINGYDASNEVQWTKDYDLTGPLDTLQAQNGFHHYSIELVGKWGINDIQSNIMAKDFWDGRADGPLSVTYVLGGSVKAKKLSSYVTSREVNIPGTGLVYQLESRSSYTYNGDRLEYILHETYNPHTSQFEATGTEAFTYNVGVVSKITTTLNGQPYAEYNYEYGLADKITETNSATGIMTTQTVTRQYENDSSDNRITVNYNFSNGNALLYEFDFLFKNIVNDKTVKSGQVCNAGNYSYDKNINPFRHLGYVDFNLQNWSVNNKLAEHVDYLACSVSTLIPLFYYYTYDPDGYPIKKITKYKLGANQNSAHHSQVDFYYE